MEIRRFRGVDDARAIIRVNVRAWRAAYDDLLPDAVLAERDPDPPENRIREYADQLREDRAGVFVATADDAVRGYGYVRWGAETKPFVGADDAGLKELYVDPEYWGEGVGTALLERALEELHSSIERVKLETLAANDRARRFYEARGFEQTGSTTFEIAGEAYPTVVYALEV